MKRKWTICILTGFFAILLVGFDKIAEFHEEYIASENTDAAAQTDTGNIYIDVAGYKIALWQQNNQYYAFLPSACKNANYEPKIPAGIDPSSIVWMYSENIPAVFIDTESGTEQIHNDKNIKETGNISVLEANGITSLELPLDYIKCRGNTSFTEFEKKQYQIKLADSVPFLGMGSAKKWVFLSNSCDPSLLRNALSRNLANHLKLAQSNEGVFADLYINGNYLGNYYVTEKIEVDNNRLDITDLEKITEIVNDNEDFTAYETAWTDTTKAKQIPSNPEDITGGYLIERDFDDRFLKEVETNGSYFITEAKECFILRSPEYASENQISYINQYVQTVENAILSSEGIDAESGKSYKELIDVDSFVRKYLLEEITANYDGGVASSFFYKDTDSRTDKLFAGPIWDYDVTWGNTPAYLGYLSDSPNRLTRLTFHADSSAWFPALYAKPEFYNEITACYQNEISDYLLTLAEQTLPALAQTTAASAEMDRIRWEQQYLKNGAMRTWEEEITFLYNYILMRKDFLDKVWIEQIPLHEIVLQIEGTTYDILYIFDGEPLPELPEAEIDYAQFNGWISEDESVPETGAPVYVDMLFHAVL